MTAGVGANPAVLDVFGEACVTASYARLSASKAGLDAADQRLVHVAAYVGMSGDDGLDLHSSLLTGTGTRPLPSFHE